MLEIIEFLGIDIFNVIWSYIKSITTFIGTLFTTLVNFLTYLYTFNSVVFVLFVLALTFSIVFGILKLIKLLPIF